MKKSKIGVDRGSRSGETCDFGVSLLGWGALRFPFATLLFGWLCASSAMAVSIGVNFNANDNEDVDNVTGSAGTVSQSNWINTENDSGTIAAGSVVDSNGSTVGGMSIAWSGDAAWSVGGALATGEGDDTALMHGGLEAHDTTYTGDNQVTLTGIPYTRYNLYIYVNGYNSSGDREGECQLLVNGEVVAGSQRPFDVMGVEFVDGTHSHSESTSTTDEGTYVLWENLTASDAVVQTTSAGVNQNPLIVGLQIVEVTVPDVAEQNIGVNFNSSIAEDVDLVTSSAGAVPQGNWNNVSNNTGSVAGSVLEDSGATLEGMSVSWSGDAAHSVGGASGTGQGDDTALMHGGFEVQDLTYTGDNEITLTGIPYVEYDLYVYVSGWNAGRTGEAQLEVGGSVVSGSQRQFQGLGTQFIDGTHTHSESSGTSDVGTYVLWKDQTATDLVIQAKNLVNGTQPLVVGLQLVKTPPRGTLVSIR